MNLLNRIQKFTAGLGATGIAATLALPAFAQSPITTPNNNVLNQNPTILNETPYNRSGQVNDRCVGYVQGGVGGPVDSSYQSGVYAPGSSSAAFTRQFDGENPSAAIPYRSNGPAATTGREASMVLDAFNNTDRSRMQAQSSRPINLDRAEIKRREFDGNNPSAALPFRTNGPATTSGRGASVALENLPQRGSSDMSASTYSSSAAQPSLSAAPIPTECVPR